MGGRSKRGNVRKKKYAGLLIARRKGDNRKVTAGDRSSIYFK